MTSVSVRAAVFVAGMAVPAVVFVDVPVGVLTPGGAVGQVAVLAVAGGRCGAH